MRTSDDITVEAIIGGVNDEGREYLGTRTLLLSYIRQNPDGITVSMASNVLGLSERYIRQILSDLCKSREIYDRKLPKVASRLYYPNGKLIHKYLQESKEIGNQIFRLSFHEGHRTPHLQIQERKYTLLEGEKVEGSIFLDYRNIEELIEFMQEMLTNFNSYSINKEIKRR
jgi:hypothetical protein